MATPENLHAARFANESTSDSKLKYLIFFGVPVVAGLAYWYYTRRNAQSKQKPKGFAAKSSIDVRAAAAKKIEDKINSQVLILIYWCNSILLVENTCR